MSHMGLGMSPQNYRIVEEAIGDSSVSIGKQLLILL